jgi:hypothetical protein
MHSPAWFPPRTNCRRKSPPPRSLSLSHAVSTPRRYRAQRAAAATAVPHASPCRRLPLLLHPSVCTPCPVSAGYPDTSSTRHPVRAQCDPHARRHAGKGNEWQVNKRVCISKRALRKGTCTVQQLNKLKGGTTCARVWNKVVYVHIARAWVGWWQTSVSIWWVVVEIVDKKVLMQSAVRGGGGEQTKRETKSGEEEQKRDRT